MQPQQQSNKKSIILLIVVLLIGAAIYFYMSGSPSDDASLVSEEGGGSGEASVVGAEVLTLLNQITSLKIDGKFFQSPVYQSLVDHTVPIYEQNVGKPNPFLDPHPKPAGGTTSR